MNTTHFDTPAFRKDHLHADPSIGMSVKEGLLQGVNSPIKVERIIYIVRFIFCRYDSLTGVPSSQRTVAFEKASVLFNIGALYTQIGTRQDRTRPTGLDIAVDNYLRAAGTFQVYLEAH